MTFKMTNFGILSCCFNNVILCNIFFKQEVQHTRNKEISLQIVSIFPINSQKIKVLVTLTLK